MIIQRSSQLCIMIELKHSTQKVLNILKAQIEF